MFKLGFTAGVCYKNQIYFSASMRNGLFVKDYLTDKAKLLCLFEKENTETLLHRNAFIYKNYAWFIPQRGKYIAKVDLDTLKIEYYETYSKVCENDEFFAYIITKRFGDKLYLLPRSVNDMVVIDMSKCEIVQINNVVNPNEEKAIDFVVNNNEINIFFCNHTYVRKIYMDTQKKEDVECGFSVVSLYKLTDDILWIVSSDSSKVLKYSLSDNKILELIEIGEENKFNGSMAIGDEVLFFPMRASGFLHININNSSYYVDGLLNEKREYPVKMMQLDTEGHEIILGADGYIVVWNNDVATIVEMDFSAAEYIAQLSEVINDKTKWKNLYEKITYGGSEEKIGLEGYIKYIEFM